MKKIKSANVFFLKHIYLKRLGRTEFRRYPEGFCDEQHLPPYILQQNYSLAQHLVDEKIQWLQNTKLARIDINSIHVLQKSTYQLVIDEDDIINSTDTNNALNFIDENESAGIFVQEWKKDVNQLHSRNKCNQLQLEEACLQEQIDTEMHAFTLRCHSIYNYHLALMSIYWTGVMYEYSKQLASNKLTDITILPFSKITQLHNKTLYDILASQID